MNNTRRNDLENALEALELVKENMSSVLEMLQTAHGEEEEYFENMPESFQDGEKGEKATEAVDALAEAISTIEEFDFDELESSINTAKE